MESTANSTPRKRKVPSSTKVKVVASRYAQTIQRTNLDAKSERSGRAPVASSSSNAASIKVGSSRAVTSKTAAQTRTGVVSSSGTRTPAPSTPAVTSGNSAGASSSDSNGTMSISDKLRLYRANKVAQRPGNAAATTSRSVTADAADPFRSTAPRPTLPERITPPTEKAPPRLSSRDRAAVSDASTPVKRRMTTPTGRTTPSKITSSFLSKPPTATVSTVAASRVPTSTTEEELELLECMYLQLCFSEATAAASFRRQEQSAERQMITAWTILQSKLQLLHDTTIRLDREVHIRSVEDRLDDQAEALVRLGSVIASFGADLDHITSALEASLQRMPTPGVVCSPPELKRQLESLSSTLQAFQNQLQSDGTGSTIADALSFTQGMEEATEQICALLLQVGHLLEEIQLEVNTETSLKAHWIQDARVQQQTRTPDWW